MKKVVITIITITVALSVFSIFSPVKKCESTSGNTLYVDDYYDNTTAGWNVDHFNNIQNAIDNASDGDTVFILTGIYEITKETSINIEKSISIVGEDKYNSVIIENSNSTNKTDLYTMIDVWTSNVTFENLSICSKYQLQSWGRYGISLRQNNCKIINCVINVSYVGVLIYETSSNNTIYNCIFNDSYDEGIFLGGFNNKINNCIFHNTLGAGIELAYSTCYNNNISHCNFYDNGHGITFIENAHYNSIFNCSVYVTGIGILIGSNSNYNKILNSSCIGCSTGIMIDSSSGNSIVDCEISNNKYEGFQIENSTDNEIYRCKIFYNNYQGIRVSHSTNNRFHHNTLICNGNFTWIAPEEKQALDGGLNQWDDGSEGNYWSDYNGSDKNNDGVGDTPYNIPGGNSQDRYPLMKIDGRRTETKEETAEPKTPGFELIFVVCAIALVLFWRRKRIN